jgi:septal ring factor EnvC (AmiA/AmiB activator)
MQRIALVLVGGCLVWSGAWAGPPSRAATTQAEAAQLNQRVAQHQAEVDHLQKDVGQQESASEQAAQRLQQQDRTIDELRQQLKAAQESARTPAGRPAGH